MSSKTNMEQTIQILKGDNQELMKENASLKRQIGGYKSSNEHYKKQAKNDALYINSLQNGLMKLKKDAQAEIERLKAYAKEADELNEGKATFIGNLKAIIEEKDRIIAGVGDQIAEINNRLITAEQNTKRAIEERDTAIANYDYVCGLPWYEKIFFKGK